ncbi:MAG: heat-inducible transcriptional repressor HrcA [Actinomycetota bacterium]|jgi:heat-inducible transcriptional repressor
MVSERALEVLRVIVADYVASREPVGSKAIVERHGFSVSAATIRNDMAVLEEENLIHAPHTSAGRIPTDLGYRMFVNHFAEMRPLSSAQRHAIEKFLDDSVDLDDVFHRTVRLLSQLTNQVALVQYPSFGQDTVRHLEIVSLGHGRYLGILILDGGRVDQNIMELPRDIEDDFLAHMRAVLNAAVVGKSIAALPAELRSVKLQLPEHNQLIWDSVVSAVTAQAEAQRVDKLVISGAANIALAEDDFGGNIVPVLDAIDEQVTLLKLFREMELDEHGVGARIGREMQGTLAETSLVSSEYFVGNGESARLGILGPTRMNYDTNFGAVRAVARYLSRMLGEQS